MKCAVAKYLDHDGPRSPYSIAFYPSVKEAEDAPHDFFLFLSPKEWRRFKCRTPRRDEVMEVELTVTEIKRERASR